MNQEQFNNIYQNQQQGNNTQFNNFYQNQQQGNNTQFNNFYQNNTINQKRPQKNKKLIIIATIIITIIIAISTFIIINNKKDNTDNENNTTTAIPDEWKKYADIKHYKFNKIIPQNLEKIPVNFEKITFTLNEKKGTLDFTNSLFSPKVFSWDGFEGYEFMHLMHTEFNEEDFKTGYIINDASIFNDVLKDDMEVKFYGMTETYNYCYIYAYGIYWVIGVNIEQLDENPSEIDESVTTIKQLIQLITPYDSTAPTIYEFTESLVRQMEFNTKRISFDNLEIYGSGLGYKTENTKTNITTFGHNFYQEYIYVSNDTVTTNISNTAEAYIKDTTNVKELIINNIPVRLYKEEIDDYGTKKYYYYAGLIENDYEYVLYLETKDSTSQLNEEKCIEFLKEFIKG